MVWNILDKKFPLGKHHGSRTLAGIDREELPKIENNN
jgi:hypothetical protein